MVSRTIRNLLGLIGLLIGILCGKALFGAPEPLQRDTQTKALIQDVLDMKGTTLTLGSLIVSDSAGIRVWDLGSTNGTRVGDTGDKIAFLGAAPVVRPSSTTDLRVALINLGLYTTGGASPLNLNGGALTAAAITGTTGTFSSTMAITGNTTIGGTLGVTGAITGPSLTLTGNASVGGTLGVTGATTLAAGLSGTSATFSTTLHATGNTTLGGTLAITGAISGAAFSFTGNGTVGGTFGATGNSTFGGTLGITGALSGSSFSFTNNGTVSGTFGVTGTSTLAALNATNGNFSGTLNVSGEADFFNIRASGNVDIGEALDVTGGTALHGGLSVTGASAIQGLTATTGAFSGLLSSPNVSLTGGTLSGITSFAGGSMALTGNETVGGTLGVTGASTFAAVNATSGTFSTTLGVTGNTTLGGTLGVTGATTMAGLSATTGSFSGTLGVSGASTLAAITGTTGTFSSTLRGKIQDTGGAVYHVKSASPALVGDGTTDDTAAFQALVDVVPNGSIIQFDAGTFRLNGLVTMTGKVGITLQGAGKGATIIKSTMPVGTPAFGSPIILLFTSCSYFNISGITFDNNNISTTNTDTSMVAVILGHDFTIADCEFINQQWHGLVLQSCQNWYVERNYFYRPAAGGNSHLHSAILGMGSVGISGPGWITSNNVVGSAIYWNGVDITAKYNIVTDSTSGTGIGCSAAADTTRANISFNTIDGLNSGQDVLGLWVSGIECYADNSRVIGNLVRRAPGIGIGIGGKNITVADNQVYDIGHASNPGIGIANNYQNSTYNGSFAIISNNKVKQILGTNMSYCYADIGAVGVTTGIQFRGNEFTGANVAPVSLAATSVDYTFDTYSKSYNLATGDGVLTTITVPAGCKNIRMSIQARGTRVATTDRIAMRFNGDAGNNYYFQTRGDITDSGNPISYFAVGHMPAASATAIYSGTVEIVIHNPTGSTFYKGVTALINRWYTSTPEVASLSGFWKITSPVTTIGVLGESAGFAAGGTMTATFEF